MTDSVKPGLLSAFRVLLRPLVRILLRHGISFAEFAEIVKAVYVEIAVTDTGCGIAPENLDTIFEEFKQAQSYGRDPRSGAGLGLAICRELADVMLPPFELAITDR